MDLHAFIRKRDLPRNRVADKIKEEVRSRIHANRTDEEVEEDEITEEWGDMGVSVRVPPGSTRFQYTVTGEQALIDYLREEIPLSDFLRETELETALYASLLLFHAINDTGFWTLVDADQIHRTDGDLHFPSETTEDLRRMLTRLGMIEQSTT